MTLTKRARSRSCRGVAAVELAILLPFLLILLLGVWETGRLIQVQQVLTNATREGARVAAQGLTIDLSNNPKLINKDDVKATVENYLRENGIDPTGLTVTFQFVNGDTGLSHPHEAEKNQRYQVITTLPFNNVRWTMLGLSDFETLQSTVTWESLVDDPFQLDTSVPTW